MKRRPLDLFCIALVYISELKRAFVNLGCSSHTTAAPDEKCDDIYSTILLGNSLQNDHELHDVTFSNNTDQVDTCTHCYYNTASGIELSDLVTESLGSTSESRLDLSFKAQMNVVGVHLLAIFLISHCEAESQHARTLNPPPF